MSLNGVFSHLVDRAAFIDRAEFGLWGVRRQRMLPALRTRPSIPIGGPNRIYARSIRGVCQVTGNPFEFRYGRLKPWPRVPPFRLVLHSNRVPLTGTQVDLVAGALLRGGFRAIVARVEVTFDLTEASMSYFRRHVFTRARRIRVLRDRSGRETLYAGGPTSSWQLCVYQKTDSIVRAEFRFRRQFLREQAIERAQNLLRLRRFNLWNLVWLREYQADALNSATVHAPELLSEKPQNWPLRTVTTFLRWRAGINRDSLLRPSKCERLLRRMQRNLIW